MSVNRRGFLKRTGVGAAVLVGGSGILGKSAFAALPPRAPEKSEVTFVGSSAAGSRRKMIADVLEPWRQTVAAGIAGKTVLIKPNLVYWNPGLKDPTLSLTHVDAIRGLIDFIRSISSTVPIVIGEIAASAASNTNTMFTRAGYTALTSEYSGVTLQDLGDTTVIPAVEHPFWTPDFSASSTVPIAMSSAFTDPRYYQISICRPKTHNCMVMTGVNKNVLMAAPLNTGLNGASSVVPKTFMHGKNGWYTGQNPGENKCLAYNLFQMANIIYPTGAPALSVLDAWEGMEGEGPVSGTSIMQYCAVASTDPLAVDRLSAKLMGFSDTPTDPMDKNNPSYTDMRALLWISNAGLGNYDLSKITFKLGSLADVNGYVKTYKLSTNYTGTPSYETEWTGGPPPAVLTSGVKDFRALDPRPYLVPQKARSVAGGAVTITFALPVGFAVQVGIFTMQGAAVRRLGNEFLPAGRYSLVWDGMDDRGLRVRPGNYLIKLQYGSRALCDHVALAR